MGIRFTLFDRDGKMNGSDVSICSGIVKTGRLPFDLETKLLP
jgi:hypothetical protein